MRQTHWFTNFHLLIQRLRRLLSQENNNYWKTELLIENGKVSHRVLNSSIELRWDYYEKMRAAEIDKTQLIQGNFEGMVTSKQLRKIQLGWKTSKIMLKRKKKCLLDRWRVVRLAVFAVMKWRLKRIYRIAVLAVDVTLIQIVSQGASNTTHQAASSSNVLYVEQTGATKPSTFSKIIPNSGEKVKFRRPPKINQKSLLYKLPNLNHCLRMIAVLNAAAANET